MVRITKPRYIMTIVDAVRCASTCPKSDVGAVFASQDYEIISMGYNGSPRGILHCSEAGCQPDEKGKCTRAVHAEANAVIQAAKRGTALRGSMLFVSRWPCEKCSMMLINLGLRTVVVPEGAKKNPQGESMLREGKITKMELLRNGSLKTIYEGETGN